MLEQLIDDLVYQIVIVEDVHALMQMLTIIIYLDALALLLLKLHIL